MTVVVTGEDTQVIATDQHSVVVVDQVVGSIIVTGIMGPPGRSDMRIAAAQDVDLNNLTDGSLLVYSAATQKWTASNTLEQQVIDSGQY